MICRRVNSRVTITLTAQRRGEFKVKESNEKREWDDSPESLVTPYEDINTRQQKITGER
jgi:hypothetical protein